MSAIVEPGTARELAAELAEANAQGRTVLPRGGGTKATWGNPAQSGDVTLSTARLNRVLEHAWADMTATVEAGCTVAALQSVLAQHGQRLAIDPLWGDRATIGGILATNDSGALRLRFGGLRDLIIGITVALPDGTLAMSGGKVVKNVAGYDLPKLMVGALGTLGVITQAVFRLHPLPRETRTLTAEFADLHSAQRFVLAIQNSQLAHSALQIRLGEGLLEADILFEGTLAGIDAQRNFVKTIASLGTASPHVWAAREELWPPANDVHIVKFSVLPSHIAQTLERIRPDRAVVQATGLGYARLSGDLGAVRRELESEGGSLAILTPSDLDAWGSPGTALPLMRAMKQQFDRNRILNRGRFAGGL